MPVPAIITMTEELKSKRKREKKDKKKGKLQAEKEEKESEVVTPPQPNDEEEPINPDQREAGEHESSKASKRRKTNGKESREERQKKRKECMDQVPKVDGHGIAYTKLQLRRMSKRVARGLDPIESEQEVRERLRREAELKREEAAELAGMDYNEGGDNANDPGESDTQERVEEEDGDDGRENQVDKETSPPVVKISKRSKLVPPDYTCQACQNKHKPSHWIYDCPDKVRMPGTNHVAKKAKGLHDPDARKLFVSGLPFEAKVKDIKAIFVSCGKLAHCKLIKFADTGRCKGQALLAFATEEAAEKALALDGSTLDNMPSKKGDVSKEPSKKELKLQVMRALNRAQTRKKQ